MVKNRNQTVSSWIGWVYFASALLLILGGLQIVSGLTALFSSDFFIVAEQDLVVFNYAAWGWINLITGALLVLVGVAVAAGKLWAQVVALVLAIFTGIALLAFLPAYPLWSIIGLVTTGFVVYALALHGDEVSA